MFRSLAYVGRLATALVVPLAVFVGAAPVQAAHTPGGTYVARLGPGGDGRPLAIFQVAPNGGALESCWIVSLFIMRCAGTPIVNHRFSFQPSPTEPPLLSGMFSPTGRANGNFVLAGRSGAMTTTLDLFWAGAASGGAVFCRPGETPTFRFGLAALRAALGEQMGGPIDCEGETSTNLTVQRTTTGIAYYDKERNSPAFTADGLTRHTLAATGIVTWRGGSNSPPVE
jgi:hypothetical protein